MVEWIIQYQQIFIGLVVGTVSAIIAILSLRFTQKSSRITQISRITRVETWLEKEIAPCLNDLRKEVKGLKSQLNSLSQKVGDIHPMKEESIFLQEIKVRQLAGILQDYILVLEKKRAELEQKLAALDSKDHLKETPPTHIQGITDPKKSKSKSRPVRTKKTKTGESNEV